MQRPLQDVAGCCATIEHLRVRALGKGYGHRPVPWAPAAHFTDETPEGLGGLQRRKWQDIQDSASLPRTTSPVTLPSSAPPRLGGDPGVHSSGSLTC